MNEVAITGLAVAFFFITVMIFREAIGWSWGKFLGPKTATPPATDQAVVAAPVADASIPPGLNVDPAAARQHLLNLAVQSGQANLGVFEDIFKSLAANNRVKFMEQMEYLMTKAMHGENLMSMMEGFGVNWLKKKLADATEQKKVIDLIGNEVGLPTLYSDMVRLMTLAQAKLQPAPTAAQPLAPAPVGLPQAPTMPVVAPLPGTAAANALLAGQK